MERIKAMSEKEPTSVPAAHVIASDTSRTIVMITPPKPRYESLFRQAADTLFTTLFAFFGVVLAAMSMADKEGPDLSYANWPSGWSSLLYLVVYFVMNWIVKFSASMAGRILDAEVMESSATDQRLKISLEAQPRADLQGKD